MTESSDAFRYSRPDSLVFFHPRTSPCRSSVRRWCKSSILWMDRELRWKPHVQRAISRATKTCLAIGRLRHLRPKQMRQLYQACVIPQMDYASTVWHSSQGCKWQISVLSKVQRLATIKTISAFRTVATETLDTEAFLLTTKPRLQHRAARVITGLQALPDTHPAHQVL